MGSSIAKYPNPPALLPVGEVASTADTGCSGACLLRSEQPITCADSEPESDVSVVKGSIEDSRHEHPHSAELVIEICVTSREYDRFKLPAYATAGVKEVWLLLAPENPMEIHRQSANGKFTEQKPVGPAGQVVCAALPEFTLDLGAVFAK
jgi:Uma2 family endonuclease